MFLLTQIAKRRDNDLLLPGPPLREGVVAEEAVDDGRRADVVVAQLVPPAQHQRVHHAGVAVQASSNNKILNIYIIVTFTYTIIYSSRYMSVVCSSSSSSTFSQADTSTHDSYDQTE